MVAPIPALKKGTIQSFLGARISGPDQENNGSLGIYALHQGAEAPIEISNRSLQKSVGCLLLDQKRWQRALNDGLSISCTLVAFDVCPQFSTFPESHTQKLHAQHQKQRCSSI